MRARGWSRVAALVALAIAAAACGGGVSDRAAVISAGGIARAAERTGDLGTARIAMTIEVAGEQVDVEGAMAMDGSAVALSFDIPGGGVFEERIVDQVLYMRAPGARAEFGTEWVRMDLSGLLPDQQEAARSSSGADPMSSLQAVAGADGEVQVLGEDEVRAGTATHYRVRLDGDTALQRLRDQGLEPTAQQIQGVEALDGESMDVWIDDQGRTVRMAFTMHLPQGSSRMVMDLYDFGTPIDIQAPPAEDTTDITERMRAEMTV